MIQPNLSTKEELATESREREEGRESSDSETWRWLVRKTRDSKPFFLVFATICGVVPGVIGYGVMQATNSHNPQLEAHLRQTARPDSLMMGQVNRERLAEYLVELQTNETKIDKAQNY